MPQPGMNGMEPAFGEAYGGHRGLLSPYPLAMSPLGGRTEYDQSVLLMLGSPATPRKRPFELLSDLVDDGGTFGEDLHPERWDVSALDEMTRYTKLGLGVGAGGEPASASEEETTVLMGRWEGRSWEEEEEEKTRRRARSEEAAGQPRQQQQPAGSGGGGGGALGGGQLATTAAERASVSVSAAAAEKGASSGGLGAAGGVGQNGAMMRRGHMVEVYQVAQEEEEAAAAAAAAAAALAARAASALGLALEHCSSEEHNYSLCQGGAGGEPGVDAPHPHHHHHHHNLPQTEEEEEEEEEEEGLAEDATPRSHKDRVEEESPPRKGDISELEEEEEVEDDDEEQEEEEEDEDEGEEGAEETTVEAEDSSSSETEGEVEAEPAKRPGERPQKRRCFWEYRRARESAAKKKLGGGEVRWSLSWSSSTLPSTLYRREGKKGRRKARKTDASDLTPNPQKLHNIGEQLQKLNAAIDGMGPVNDLPAVARARSRKEKNKLASRACRLKKKAQHEANKIKLWGLNQEYENLLGALLRIKEVIRRRVESSEEEDTDERGMTQRLEDILKESSGPLVAGRTKDFVQRILAASAVGQSNKGKETAQAGEDEEAG